MILKFIGTDYSMGLRHGGIYDVEIKSDKRFIWVFWNDGRARACPYTTLNNLAANWKSVKNNKED